MKLETDPERRPDIKRHVARVSPWMFVDGLIWALMFTAALWLRFDFSLEQLVRSFDYLQFYVVLSVVLLFAWMIGWIGGIYRGRYVAGSLHESAMLVATYSSAVTLAFFGQVLAGPNEGVPRSTPLIAGAFTILTSLVLRSVIRREELFGAGASEGAEPVVVFGAGNGGRQLVQQLRRSPEAKFSPRAILDDDPAKQGLVVDGVRVRGSRHELTEVTRRLEVGTLLIAVPSLPREDLIDIRDRAEAAGLHVLVLPPIHSMMKGRVAVDELREINVNDLLGRTPARLNQTQIAEYLRGKRVLVTGAGGSIGSELCRQIFLFRPAELMMLDRDESGLHAVQLSMHDQAMLDGDDTILASIRDRDTLFEIFANRKPQIVFHAAALKHMPLLENYPAEALKTNVLGTLNVLEAATASGVESFVNISTDKAANPCSVLGASKRIAERLTSAAAADGQFGKFVSVRFGNVLGSRGSVLTVFERQIREGGPVTVTDPEVTRYFMTIPEACQLVLQSAVVGATGETLVLDMGKPVKITEVASSLIEHSGEAIEIVYTGLRENEKLAEELFDDSESPVVGGKHEALSVVRVPPLRVSHDLINKVAGPMSAKRWLKDHTHE